MSILRTLALQEQLDRRDEYIAKLEISNHDLLTALQDLLAVVKPQRASMPLVYDRAEKIATKARGKA